MPFQSESQRRFMWAKHPKIAKRWADKYGGGKGLPMHKGNVARVRALGKGRKK